MRWKEELGNVLPKLQSCQRKQNWHPHSSPPFFLLDSLQPVPFPCPVLDQRRKERDPRKVWNLERVASFWPKVPFELPFERSNDENASQFLEGNNEGDMSTHGDPDLGPIDDVFVSHFLGLCRKTEGVQPRVRFRHSEANFVRPVDDWWQISIDLCQQIFPSQQTHLGAYLCFCSSVANFKSGIVA